MQFKNKQEKFWSGHAGTAYLFRNSEISNRYEERKKFYELFEKFDKSISILEVGCNCGINLQILSKMGFTNLSGIDIGASAIAEAKKRLPKATFHHGSILGMPYGDREFDVVFSSGVLIHQDPIDALPAAMLEMIRCSKKYIVGIEDYCESVSMGAYCGSPELYWRAPFADTWASFMPELEVEKKFRIENPRSRGKYQRECYRIIIP